MFYFEIGFDFRKLIYLVIYVKILFFNGFRIGLRFKMLVKCDLVYVWGYF